MVADGQIQGDMCLKIFFCGQQEENGSSKGRFFGSKAARKAFRKLQKRSALWTHETSLCVLY